MKKMIAAVISAAMLFTAMVPAWAASDATSTLVDAMTDFQEQVTFKSDNQNDTLLDAFNSDPRLFYYFYKYEDTISPNGKKHTMTISYLNTDTPIDSVFVVNDSDDLYNVVGMALAETLTSVPMVITDSSITKDDIVSAIDQWKSDNYLVYMGYQGASAKTANAEISSWTSCTLELDYMEDSATVQQWRTDTEDKIEEICTSLFALDMPDYQKELLIHDYIVDNCTYEESATDDSQYTAYGCLCNGKAVCEGYAEAAYLLFQAAGLDCYYVEGAGSSSDHAWNCVSIQGSWYWVDVTWDDPVPADGGSETLSHDYFNLTDSQLNTDHSWQTAEYPSCTSTTWNYDAVKSALDEAGTDTSAYTDYSSRNLVTVDEAVGKLEIALGVTADEVAADAAAAENTSTETSSTETGTAETAAAESASADTDAQTTHHPVRTVLTVILVIALLFVLACAGYIGYSRMMYKKRAMARKHARQGSRPRTQSSRPAQRSSQPARQSRPRTQSSRPAQRSERPASRPSSSSSSQQSPRLNGAGRPRRENPFRH